ncbi:MAG: lipocalin-like domain-containing protein [Bryobacteraceae bacterium]
MRRRMAMGVMAGSAAGAVRDQFLGVWRLVSCERKLADGSMAHPYGKTPVGRLTYDKAGRMSAQLMTPGRRSTVAPGMNMVSAKASAEEIREAVGGYAAYFGTFDVDERERVVIHHVEAALTPSWVGTDLRRAYRFAGKRLSLTAALPGLTTELIWAREAD